MTLGCFIRDLFFLYRNKNNAVNHNVNCDKTGKELQNDNVVNAAANSSSNSSAKISKHFAFSPERGAEKNHKVTPLKCEPPQLLPHQQLPSNKDHHDIIDVINNNNNNGSDLIEQYWSKLEHPHVFGHIVRVGEGEWQESDNASANLLITFDYGFPDSMQQQHFLEHSTQVGENTLEDNDNEYDNDNDDADDAVDDDVTQLWFCAPPATHEAAQFTVHRMRHSITAEKGSFLSALIEDDVEDDEQERSRVWSR